MSEVDGRVMFLAAAGSAVVGALLSWLFHDDATGDLMHSHAHTHHAHSHGESAHLLDAEHCYEAVVDPCELTHSHEHHGHEHHSHSQSCGGGGDAILDAARLHAVMDLAQSLVVACCGLCIWASPRAKVLDPLCSLLFSALLLRATLPLAHRLALVLLEAAPDHVSLPFALPPSTCSLTPPLLRWTWPPCRNNCALCPA